MIAKADVLVENFAPGTLERLGLGWAVAREHNPRLVYASGSGYGSDGRISEATFTFYVWKKRYGGIGPSELRRLRQLEEENRKLKQIVADLSLDKAMLQAVVAKKL